MSVRRTRTVEAPPAKALAALATAAENLEYTVRRADPGRGLLVAAGPWTREAASLGYIATARTRARPPEVEVEVDVTPRVGFWALPGSAERADALLEEFDRVLQAPKARIRRPVQAGRPERPFGYRPTLAGVAWALTSLLVYGVAAGGAWWVPAALGTLGGGLLAFPRPSRLWGLAVTAAAIGSVPFGLLGIGFRREALAQAYWRAAKADPRDHQGR